MLDIAGLDDGVHGAQLAGGLGFARAARLAYDLDLLLNSSHCGIDLRVEHYIQQVLAGWSFTGEDVILWRPQGRRDPPITVGNLRYHLRVNLKNTADNTRPIGLSSRLTRQPQNPQSSARERGK